MPRFRAIAGQYVVIVDRGTSCGLADRPIAIEQFTGRHCNLCSGRSTHLELFPTCKVGAEVKDVVTRCWLGNADRVKRPNLLDCWNHLCIEDGLRRWCAGLRRRLPGTQISPW